jgi:hypothetical protein
MANWIVRIALSDYSVNSKYYERRISVHGIVMDPEAPGGPLPIEKQEEKGHKENPGLQPDASP